jgi:dTMP kinase
MTQTLFRRGLTIAYEGLDGAGKTTQIGLLAQRLEPEGHRLRLLRLNANHVFKNQCRLLNAHDLIGPVEAALMKAAELAGRVDLLQPLVAAGTTLVWDKYVVGSIASDLARGVSRAHADAILESLPEPDVTVYLELTPEDALARKASAGGPRVMESGLDVAFGSARQAHVKWAAGEIDVATVAHHFLAFQARMREAYEQYLPKGRTLRLDARQPAAALADVTMRRVRELQVACA